MDRQFLLFRFWAPSDPANVIWQAELCTEVHSDISVVSTHYTSSTRTVRNWAFGRFSRPPLRHVDGCASLLSQCPCMSCRLRTSVVTIAAFSTDTAAVQRVACILQHVMIVQGQNESVINRWSLHATAARLVNWNEVRKVRF